MNSTFDREWVISEFKQSLCALAADGLVALATQPPESVRADELALEFDHFHTIAISNIGSEFTEQQLEALQFVCHCFRLIYVAKTSRSARISDLFFQMCESFWRIQKKYGKNRC